MRRAFLQCAGVVAAALVIAAGGGCWWHDQRVGQTPADTRRKIEADARTRMAATTRGLERAVAAVADRAADVEPAASGDGPSLARLFDAVSLDPAGAGASLEALSVYAADGAPVAWAGRPSALTADEFAAPGGTVMRPTPLGTRIVRTAALVTPDRRRRVGVVVAEAALSPLPSLLRATGSEGTVLWQTALAPVAVRAGDESGDPASFDLTTASGAPLGTAALADEAVAEARTRAAATTSALMWLVAALGLLVVAGPLADWRVVAPTTGVYVAVTFALAALVVGAAAMAHRAIDLLRLGWSSEARFVATALAALALAAIVASSVSRARALGVGWRAPTRGAWWPGVMAGLVAGGVAALWALGHQRVMAGLLPVDIGTVARFSLTPLEPGRLAATLGLIAMESAAALAFATACVALLPLSVGRRAGWPPLLAGGAAALAVVLTLAPGPSPGALVGIAFGVVVLAALFDGGMRTLRRGSTPARLLVGFVALVLPVLSAYPAISRWAMAAREAVIADDVARQVAGQRQDLQVSLRAALAELDRVVTLPALIGVPARQAGVPVPTDAAFSVWSQTTLASRRLTSSIELYDSAGRMVSRFALNLPETAVDQAWQETACQWELFEEVSPFFAEERRLLHAGRGVCVDGVVVGAIVVHVVLDYANLPFLAAQQPYVALVGSMPRVPDPRLDENLALVVYGWSRRPLYTSGGDAWTLPAAVFERLTESREPFWTVATDGAVTSDVYLLSDRGTIYAIGYPRHSLLTHLANAAELIAVTAAFFAFLALARAIGARLGGSTPANGHTAMRQVRASFSRTLFLAFVAAVVVPVVALALVTRAYMATSLRQDIEREATRTVLSASRVVEDFAAIESRGTTNLPVLDDSLLVWLSRVIGEDINVFAGSGLLASSERALFASGLLPTRTPGETYRSLVLEGRPTVLTRESVGAFEYQVVSALVRVDDEQAIVSVPLTLRQRGIERQVDELDRRVTLAAIAFILLGSAIGYWAAERISDPVSRLTRATRRLASGDLDAHVLVRTSDELGRLVEAFNGMAADLRGQRAQLERTNRLEAWAEMARQVAHDIKNPLTPIQLNAEHLRRVHVDSGSPLGPLVDACVDNILQQVRLLRQLASEFSSFASAPEARPVATLVQPLVDELLAPYRAALAPRIEVVTEGDGSARALVDPWLLARALTNVVENALHAMPGDGRLVVRIVPGDGARVRIDTVDTGVGMDEQALARIFEPYFSTKATGTGLGLTIARRNIEANGGMIEVVSAPGRGTTVSMWVPAA